MREKSQTPEGTGFKGAEGVRTEVTLQLEVFRNLEEGRRKNTSCDAKSKLNESARLGGSRP